MQTIHSLFIVALLFLPSTSSFAASKTEKEYWKTTKLTISKFKTEKLTLCAVSAKHFQACFESLDKLASLLSPALNLLVDQEATALDKNVGKKVTSFTDGVSLYANGVDEDQLSDLFTERDKRNASLQNHLKIIEDQFQTNPLLDFNTILTDLLNRISTDDLKENEPFYAAKMLNTFVGVEFDPHTRYKSFAEWEDLRKGDTRNFEGAGIHTRNSPHGLIVFRIKEGSPAREAGVKPFDIITEINGIAVNTLTTEQIAKALNALEGENISFKIRRTRLTLNLSFKSKKFSVKTITHSPLSTSKKKLGYIKLRDFLGANNISDFKGAIEDLTKQGAQGLIVDLRDNGGGYIDQALQISNYFVGKGAIVGRKDLSASSESDIQFYGVEKPALTHLPTVVLINAGSASASEIMAGALQDQQKAWILGDRSYGKGTVQDSEKNTELSTWFFHTTQRFYQPSGRSNQISGIIPDFVVAPFPDAKAEDWYEEREADEFKNSLPPVGDHWSQPRKKAVSAIKKCMNKSGQKDELYQKENKTFPLSDYRVLAAEDLLNCLE